MHKSSKQELLRSHQHLESKIEQKFSGSKAELEQKCDQHHGLVERNSTELDEVGVELKVWTLWCDVWFAV